LGLDQVHRLALKGELGGVRVAESVRVDPLLDARAARETRHKSAHVGARE